MAVESRECLISLWLHFTTYTIVIGLFLFASYELIDAVRQTEQINNNIQNGPELTQFLAIERSQSTSKLGGMKY